MAKEKVSLTFDIDRDDLQTAKDILVTYIEDIASNLNGTYPDYEFDNDWKLTVNHGVKQLAQYESEDKEYSINISVQLEAKNENDAMQKAESLINAIRVDVVDASIDECYVS